MAVSSLIIYMLFADQQINAGNGQNNGKQDDGGCRRIGRIATAVTVKHVVNIADDGVHFSGIQIGTEQRNGITVGLECTDESGDDQIKNMGEIIGRVILRKILVREVPSTLAAL